MKKNILILSICSLITLSSCNNNTSSSNSSTLVNSSSINEIITGIEIAGPKSCMVGKTIRLIADVLGSDNDDVIWKSNNLEIATINEEGVLTGLSEGEVEIKAISKKDETKFNTTLISITLPKAKEINVEIEANESVTYDKNTNTYSIPLGQTFYVNSIFEDVKVPDVSYSITYPSGTSENTTVKLEMIENTTKAKVIAYAAMEGLVITATGTYNDLATGNLIDSVKINIIDINNEKYLNTQNLINSFKEKEINSLLSSNIKRTKEVIENNETYKEVHELKHTSFTNSSYVNKTILKYTNDNLNETKNINYYQGFNTINMKEYYYTFEYDENENISNIYTPSNNKENLTSIFDINTNITYGHYGLLNNILCSSNSIVDGSISTLGNIYIYAYANYEITSNSIKITSSCYDEDYSVDYNFEFELNYSADSITSYSLNEEIKNGTTTIKYSEEANEFIYGTKELDNENNNQNYLDINKYYITDFEVKEFKEKDPNGTFDYSDKNKYGADVVSKENGLTKYSATYDKAIILKVNALEPTTANVNLDSVSLESSNSDQIPSVVSFKDGIFAINAKKDDNGNSLPGKAIFTFKTTLGYEEKIIIEFTKTILKSINVNFGNNGPKFDSSKNTYVFNSIYQYDYSSYFFINTNPDEDIYKFGINIIEGNENGLSLYKFDETNIYCNPGFSYGIYGEKPGTYKFKIYVVDYFIEEEKIFEITIKEPLSIQNISDNIIGNSYEYKGFSTITSKFKFTSSTLITYTETTVDGTITSTFNYHIEKGAIVVDSTQNFTKGSYFSRLNQGKIIFSNDFKTLKFHLEIYSDNQLEGTNFFQYYDYEFVVEPIKDTEIYDYINNKTFINDDNTIKVTFNNGKGTLELYDYGGTLIASFTFDYKYNSTLKNIVISNTTSTLEGYSLVESDYVFNYYNQVLEFKIHIDNAWGGYDDKYTIALQ